ncbi:MAG: NYN domain-containing protein [Bacteroidetes bacterium]|nr:NYN domain-containing protein [Bacteroidota bacterium]MBS1630882.1 NYN domain-containing protein [Bacteroidota bacterium]
MTKRRNANRYFCPMDIPQQSSFSKLIPSGSPHTAVFIDYENIHYYIKNNFRDPPELGSYTSEIIRSLRQKLEADRGLQVIITNAYADFERMGGGSLSQLYLMGIVSQNVLGTAHKNAADMHMCIDLMQLLYTRPDMDTFVLVAGDRDYIPVVQHLKRRGRHVLVAAFRDTLSGDLLEIIGEANFIDIQPLLSDVSLARLNEHKAKEDQKKVELPKLSGPKVIGKISLEGKVKERSTFKATYPSGSSSATGLSQPGFNIPMPADPLKECLMHILNYIEERRQPEPGITLLLRYLTDEMPQLANWERKELLEQLQLAGALNVVQKPGMEYSFSVAVINYEHPMVTELMH